MSPAVHTADVKTPFLLRRTKWISNSAASNHFHIETVLVSLQKFFSAASGDAS